MYKNIYQRLQSVRIELQNMELHKTGRNTFQGYEFWELSDFMPAVQYLFDKHGLTGVISCTSELATLKIYDHFSQQTIVITCPFEAAQLKGSQPIQNVGASITYIRRYLWMLAVELLDKEQIDEAPEAPPKPGSKPEPEPKAFQNFDKNTVTEYEEALRNAPDLPGLAAAWASIPKEHQRIKILITLKNDMKLILKDD